MNKPLVSVVIPTYNGKDHLGETIQSVLDQTYDNFEIIVVDDASPEDMSYIVNSFSDVRIRYIRHSKNKGAVAARRTGAHASTGNFIALLDQDDLYHKEKLEAHVNYLEKHPEIGVTYNSRFELLGSANEICGLWHPPAVLTLTNLVLGYPISPSDTVLRREWALRDEIWDDSFASREEHVIFNGQEIVFGGRLALAGCQFGYVSRALNFRRLHPHRALRYLAARCKSELACQDLIFNDPRCPEDILKLRNIASSNIYLMWAFAAYLQEEFDLAQDFLTQAVKLKPSLLAGEPCELVNSWVSWITLDASDHGSNYEKILYSIFENLPEGLHWLKNNSRWAIARGHLLKGMQSMIWGRPEDAGEYLAKAEQMGAMIDELSAQMFISKLLDYETEFGDEACQKIIDNFAIQLKKLGKQDGMRLIKGIYTVNRAFRNYHDGRFDNVPYDVARAVTVDLKFLLNKGVLSIFFHSLFSRLKG